MARKPFSPDIKWKALEKYRNCCYKCGIAFNEPPDNIQPQYDHKNGNNEDNSLRNCGPSCANCHDKKSRKENSKRDRGGDDDFGFGDPFGGRNPADFGGSGSSWGF